VRPFPAAALPFPAPCAAAPKYAERISGIKATRKKTGTDEKRQEQPQGKPYQSNRSAVIYKKELTEIRMNVRKKKIGHSSTEKEIR